MPIMSRAEFTAKSAAFAEAAIEEIKASPEYSSTDPVVREKAIERLTAILANPYLPANRG
jgi:hypothetical protein